MNFKISFIVLILILVGCNHKSERDMVAVKFQETETQELSLLELKKRNIEYEKVGESEILINKRHFESVAKMVQEIADKVLPPDRSSSVDPKNHEEIATLLKEKNIKFTEVTSAGMVFFVFDSAADMQEFEEILDGLLMDDLRSIREKELKGS